MVKASRGFGKHMKKITYILCLLALCCGQAHAGISRTEEDAISSFAQVYGIVRYFSPNPYTVDWDEDDWYMTAYRYFKTYRESGNESGIIDDFLNVFAPNATLTSAPDSTMNTTLSTPFYFNEHFGS